MEFMWDENKRKINLDKHKIDFEDVKEAFNNFIYEIPDNRFDYSEDRIIGIVPLRNILITIVFTEPKENIIRLISARKSTSKEKRLYEKEWENRLENPRKNE